MLGENGVHGLGSACDHRLELVPVDRLGNRRAGVADEISDGLDRYAVGVLSEQHQPQKPRPPEPQPSQRAGGDYPDAVYLAIGSGPGVSPAVIRQQETTLARLVGSGHPGNSAIAYQNLETDLNEGIDADQALFTASATSGDGALGGLVAGMVIAAMLMAAGCAWA